jgi:hypothetical protein
MSIGPAERHSTAECLGLARNRVESALMALLATYDVRKRGEADA